MTDTMPPLFWRVVLNPLRRWLEDRHVQEHHFVPQMRALWKPPPPSNVRPFLNLVVTRGAKTRRVA